MRKNYPFEMKLYVIEARKRKDSWAKIKNEIELRFHFEAPTIRTMQNWEKGGDQTALQQVLKEKAAKQVETAKAQAFSEITNDLLPRLVRSQAMGEDTEYAGWQWFFSVMESMLGTEKFNKFIDRYRETRKDRPSMPPTEFVEGG